MKLKDIKKSIPEEYYNILTQNIKELRPCQEKSLKAGLLKQKSLLVCTPTASGKTLVAELAMIQAKKNKGKTIYIVPLKALASEKYKEFKNKYKGLLNIGISIGDLDRVERLDNYDVILVTSEKLDSLIRHKIGWLKYVSTIVIDEIHLLNDPGRGPTLEILITMLKRMLKDAQILGLSATIGNPKELAEWLNAKLIIDNWRPVKLHKGIHLDGEVEFY